MFPNTEVVGVEVLIFMTGVILSSYWLLILDLRPAQLISGRDFSLLGLLKFNKKLNI